MSGIDDLKKLQGELHDQLSQMRDRRGRKGPNPAFPYLLIRGYAGDVGARPLPSTQPSWESPDVLAMAGTGAFDRSKCTLSPVPGQDYTIFVHVWNLGRSPVYGAELRVWWVQPGFFNPATQASYTPMVIGGTFVDLDGAGGPECHKLVAIPTPWHVVPDNDGHECLLASIHHPMDPWSGQLDAINDRHVAQRNMFLTTGQTDLSGLIKRFGELVAAGGTLNIVGDHLAVLSHLEAHAPDLRLPEHGLVPDKSVIDALRGHSGGVSTVKVHDFRPGDLTDHGLGGAAGGAGGGAVGGGGAGGGGAGAGGLGGDVTRANAGISLASQLRDRLKVRDLTAADIAGALPALPVATEPDVGKARLLRFTCSEDGKVTGGYTLLVAP